LVKVNSLITKEFLDKNQNLFIKLLIFSFLKEDKVLFTKVKRPLIENLKYEEDKMFESIGTYYKNVEETIVKNQNIKFTSNRNSKSEKIKNLFTFYNPKSKSHKVEGIQEFQAKSNFYHQIISIGIFCGFTFVLFYLTMKKK